LDEHIVWLRAARNTRPGGTTLRAGRSVAGP